MTYKNQKVLGMSEQAGIRFQAFRNRMGMTTSKAIEYLLDRVELPASLPREGK